MCKIFLHLLGFLMLMLTSYGKDSMRITKKEQETIDFYHKNAAQWIADYGFLCSKNSFWEKDIIQFNHYLPSGNILEIGFGGGKEAAKFIEMGYSYVGIDPAKDLVNKLQKHFPHAVFLQKNVYDLNFPSIKFDGFWCTLVLFHIPPNSINQALNSIKKVIKPGGIGFIVLLEGEGEYYDKETGRWFFLYKSEKFATILKNNDFYIEKQNQQKFKTNEHWFQKFATNWQTYFVRT